MRMFNLTWVKVWNAFRALFVFEHMSSPAFGFRDAVQWNKLLTTFQRVSSVPVMTLEDAVAEAQASLPNVETTRLLAVSARNSFPFGPALHDLLQMGAITYTCHKCANGGMCMLITDLHLFPEQTFQQSDFLPVRDVLSRAVIKLFAQPGALHCVTLQLEGCAPRSASRDGLCDK